MGPSPKLTVLVFNDSVDVLETLETWFHAHGHVVYTAQMSAIRGATLDVPKQMIEKHQPDVIVYDIGIPYRPNWDVLEVLRLSKAFEGVPVVITTSNKIVLSRLVGENDALEMHGLRDDLDAILKAAENAVARKRET